MKIPDYKTILYFQKDGSWIAEIALIPGCCALMNTREKVLEGLSHVFEMVVQEYRGKNLPLPADTTEIIHA